MTDADLISSVRNLRRLVVALDSINFPVVEMSGDEDKSISDLIPKGLSGRIKKVSTEVHRTLQNIEHSKRYKNAVKTLCSIKERN